MLLMDEARRDLMFPKLAPGEIEHVRRFGETLSFAAGERLLETGGDAKVMFVLISGTVDVKRRNPLGPSDLIVSMGPGDFIAEVGQLSGGTAMVDVDATSDGESILVPPDRLRALLIAETELGDRIMRALILRRMTLIETGAGGPILVGPENSPDIVRLQGFLARNTYPHQVYDPAQHSEAADLVRRYAPDPSDLPLAVCPNGTILKNPSEMELARALGMVRTDTTDRTFDVAIVGAGPAGLSTAVYGASEGLSAVVLDKRAFGGQAGASARIENYLGFPTGISGLALTERAYVQAQKFGAEMHIPSEVSQLDCSQQPFVLDLSDGRQIRARTVVIAAGARYRRLNLPNLHEFEGKGVWYGASPIEARLCRQSEIALVGGGNSAGQGAVFLSEYAKKIWMLVRGPDLSETMSRYLIDRIHSIPNIEVLTRTEVTGLSGTTEGQLERVRWRNNANGEETEKPIRNLFLFIGADPATEWLQGCGVAVDEKGFIRTGSADGQTGPASSPVMGEFRLQTSVPGVFAVGDVRAGSVKRVGGAIGEGAAVVPEVHATLTHLA